ncbi:MAG: hypothetical protein JWL76_1864, partial [Thermoleophilia bacterium]|nr:hypothetical protein [Thermoleophilia bacterium]
MSHAQVARTSYVTWIPALLLLVAGVLAAAGFGGIANSHAASTGTTTVTATVAKEVHVALNTTGSCGPAGGSATTRSFAGATMATTDGDVSLASCRVTFGSNNSALGANLLVESTRTSGTNSFCAVAAAGACAAPQFTEAATAGVAPATFAVGEPAAAGFFGIKANVNAASCTGG